MFVKICGITTEEDALLSVAMGADAVGFVMAPSTRQISPTRVGDIVRRLPPEILTVGVFRDESPERVVEIVSKSGLRAAQLHGHESVADSLWVGERVPIVLKAFPAGSRELERAADYKPDLVLIDAATPGSGEMFDWSLAEDAPRRLPIIMAGGLTPGNVVEAIGKVHPWGVDVSSGVERSPGRKDPRLVRDFIRAARSAPTGDWEPVTAPEDLYDWQRDERGR
jgi:phosphoribosylanthranilate isomerase